MFVVRDGICGGAAEIADELKIAACMCQRVFTRITPTRSVFHFAQKTRGFSAAVKKGHAAAV